MVLQQESRGQWSTRGSRACVTGGAAAMVVALSTLALAWAGASSGWHALLIMRHKVWGVACAMMETGLVGVQLIGLCGTCLHACKLNMYCGVHTARAVTVTSGPLAAR